MRANISICRWPWWLHSVYSDAIDGGPLWWWWLASMCLPDFINHLHILGSIICYWSQWLLLVTDPCCADGLLSSVFFANPHHLVLFTSTILLGVWRRKNMPCIFICPWPYFVCYFGHFVKLSPTASIECLTMNNGGVHCINPMKICLRRLPQIIDS